MSTKYAVKNKNKKPLKTTLGKAVEPPEKCPDLSHVRKPIDTSIFGLRQVLTLFETATEEVKHYITYECDVMYECRICRTIFRSLANFILHKRSYCTENYNPRDHTNCRNNCEENEFAIVNVEEINGDSRESSPIRTEPKSNNKDNKKSISTVLKKLLQKQEDNKLVEDILNTDISGESSSDKYKDTEKKNDVALEQIQTTDVGVFQTMFRNMSEEHSKMDCMKSQVMELHGLLSEEEAVIGEDGKILQFETEKANSKEVIPKNNLLCTICNQKFATRKTLTYHVKYKHNNTRMVYPCPVCKDQLANAWCVFRHLYKVHRKTNAQVRRMREQVHAAAFRKDREPTRRKDMVAQLTNGSQEKNDSENQWMEDVEGDNDLQMCGGCGRRFERKAALHSHSQLCHKRIAVCNTIKEKHASEEKQVKPIKRDSRNEGNVLKGAERRKPQLLRRKVESKELSVDEKVADYEKDTNEDSCVHDIVFVDASVAGNNTKDEDVNVSDVDVFSTIGIVNPQTHKEVDKNEDEVGLKQAEVILIEDSGSDEDTALDEDKRRSILNEDIENALREIESICDSNEASTRKRRYSLDGKPPKLAKIAKIGRISCDLDSDGESNQITLQMKAKDYMDVDKCLCIPCNMNFPSFLCLIDHMSLHFSWFCFQCSKCQFMSYEKQTCIAHVTNDHKKCKGFVDNTVLPVPNWKTILMSTGFTDLSNVKTIDLRVPCEEEISEVAPNDVAAVDVQDENKDNSEVPQQEDNGVDDPEVCLLEQPETILFEEEAGYNTADMQDPSVRKMVLEVIFGSEVDSTTFSKPCPNSEGSKNLSPSNISPTESSRPVRNRVKSVKTMQEDFLYDMTQILKLPAESYSSKKVNVGQRKGDVVNKISAVQNLTNIKVSKPMKVYARKANLIKANNDIEVHKMDD